jgi:RNA polymerase sigma factor (sigma-70 family)
MAEDLAQESMARAFGRLGQLRHADRFDAYARRILVNLVRKGWRRAARERAYVDGDARRVAARTVADPAEVVADAQDLWDAMLRLPVRQRAAIVLRYYADLSERATAEALGCRVGTVKSLVHRGLATMRSEIEAHDE